MQSTYVRPNPRNPFPGEAFFPVPTKLYDGGFARIMGNGEFKRYATLLRVANYQYGERAIQMSLENLRVLDGIAPRTARQIHTKLQERGLIHVVKTRPLVYRLIPSSLWQDLGPLKPQFESLRRLQVRLIWNPPGHNEKRKKKEP